MLFYMKNLDIMSSMETIIIKSSFGSYTGTCVDKINTFYGIPYAQSCADMNRWQAPKELKGNYLHIKNL